MICNKKKIKKIRSYYYGQCAEILVCIFLSLKGYRIIERRYKTKFGEIDLIAIKKKRLIFIEVKARKMNKKNYNKTSNIDEVLLKQQMLRIINASLIFLTKNKKFADYSVRFDLVIVKSFFVALHMKNAWENNEYTQM